VRVHNIMTAKPITAHPGDTIAYALEQMKLGGFHHLPIISTSGHLIGIVTERDCRVALNVPDINQIDINHVPAARNTKLRDIMSRAPIVTSPSTDILDAATLMYENHINCLPVMIEETLVGIMTSSDLLVAFIQMSRSQRAHG
jgi:acetoin utilization protein AcuB